ncbi:MAG: DUF6036 family nucleotidyltransferase [Ignavibacteriaceae bacterium]
MVGGEAVIFYGHARLTGDIDFYYDRSTENINKLFKALNKFWNNSIPGIKGKNEFKKEGMVFQFGIPPNRIDLINSIEDIDFSDAWGNRFINNINYKKAKIEIYYIGIDDLIKNKKAVKRNKDKDDLKFLVRAKKKLDAEKI